MSSSRRRTPKKSAAVPPLAAEVRASFRVPVWPERACRDLVTGEFANYSCDVVEGHLGPHASGSVPQSVAQRVAWEAKHPDELEPTAAADPFHAA
ncbi:hypothetical protein ABZS76_32690 [Streptomyces sp. NPDC005562]|uniref:hypothetical protein n=1 Tax=Streptomyces sp. NPDC005562 TaxID=3154890 RepID=UPI0033AEDB44